MALTAVKLFAVAVCVALGGANSWAGVLSPTGRADASASAGRLGEVRTDEFRQLRERLARGWNTLYSGSMTAHVLLPEGFAVNFGLASSILWPYQREFLRYSEYERRPERIVPGLRSDDGAYTSATIRLKNFGARIETAADGSDFVALVTPTEKSANFVVVEAGMAFAREGFVGRSGDQLVYSAGERRLVLSTTAEPETQEHLQSTAPRLCVRLDRGPIGFWTGRVRTLDEIRRLIGSRRAEQEKRVSAWGKLAENFQVMQTVLAWNTIYNARERRVITPVSRVWNLRQYGGWVLYEWDTYFAAYMLSFFNRDLAYANAVEITKSISKDGYIYVDTAKHGAPIRSQPPVGSRMVWEIYSRYRDRWFLEETYDELLSWNRWWPEARGYDGYLAWGAFQVVNGRRVPAPLRHMKFESGLDNLPIFDNVPMNRELGIMMQADVGLMSLYVMDCKALAKIAAELGREADARELSDRARRYCEKLETLWCEEKGIYLCRRLDTGRFCEVLTPCSFYPLLTGACPKEHIDRMLREHYYNPKEFYGKFIIPTCARNTRAFKDNNYFRGRIWPPINLLVYLALKEGRQDEACADLARRSHDLLMQNWRRAGCVYENYNSVTGAGGDVFSSDGYYHWGALLSFMGILEGETGGRR